MIVQKERSFIINLTFRITAENSQVLFQQWLERISPANKDAVAEFGRALTSLFYLSNLLTTLFIIIFFYFLTHCILSREGVQARVICGPEKGRLAMFER